MGLADILGGAGDGGNADGGGAAPAGGEGSGGSGTADPAAASGAGTGGSGGDPGRGAAGDGGGAGADGGAGAGGDHWLAGLTIDDELREWATKKGFDKLGDPSLLVRQYRDLERLKRVGEEELLRVPTDLDITGDQMGEVFRKLGRPEKGELGEGGYDLPEIPGVDADDDIRPHFAKWAHEAGLNNAQANVVMERFVAFAQEAQARIDEAFQIDETQAVAQLRREYGQAYPELQAAGTAAASKLGLSGQDLDGLARALGSKRAIEILGTIGRGMGEHRTPTPSSDGAPGVITPAQAKEKVTELMNDPAWKESWMKGDQRKVKQLLELNRIAAGLAA